MDIRCIKCGRKLFSAHSISRGLGPTCAGDIGRSIRGKHMEHSAQPELFGEAESEEEVIDWDELILRRGRR